jgi:hypothetical protein
MNWLQSTYTQSYNARHKVFGHSFQGRYKPLVVDASTCQRHFSLFKLIGSGGHCSNNANRQQLHLTGHIHDM